MKAGNYSPRVSKPKPPYARMIVLVLLISTLIVLALYFGFQELVKLLFE
jgi:hypothetical protein